MIGCLFRTVTFAALVGGAAWYFRDAWTPAVFGREAAPSARPAAQWVSVGDTSASRALKAAQALGRRGGPAFVTVAGEDAAALALRDLRGRLPSGLTDVEVRVRGDTVDLRAVVRPADFGGREVLGPVYGMLPERDTITIAGGLEGLAPGVGQFRVFGIRFRDLPLPPKAVAPLLRQLTRGQPRPDGLSADAFPVPLPADVGDVRVRNGSVVLYRAQP